MGIFGPSKKSKHSIQINSDVYEEFVEAVKDKNPDEVVELFMQEYSQGKKIGTSEKSKHCIQVDSSLYEAFARAVKDENPDEVVKQFMRDKTKTIDVTTVSVGGNSKSDSGNGGSRPGKKDRVVQKDKAVQLAREVGFEYKRPTYASWRISAYWMNPAPERLDQDWMILLDDIAHRKLHIFVVPGGTLDISQFRRRKDNGKLDIYINENFIDSPRESAHVDFSKYFKQTIDY